MNCANHPDRERSAFCQNCGKPLCNECVRNAGASIYCEPCFTARTNPSAPPAGYGYPPPGTTGYPPPGAAPGTGQPNPMLAALLGFIPGVGAMYNEQYGKGIVHLVVFAVLVSLADNVNGIFGLFVAGWIFYMVIEAHHTARARRDGTPLPNPFGLNDVAERLGFGKAWPGSSYTPPPYAAPSNPDPTAAPVPGQTASVPPANPYAQPYGYGYTPPPASGFAPQDAYGRQTWGGAYEVPPVPPAPPVPPVPPYPDPDLHHRSIPTGAIWLIGLGLLFLVGNTGIFHIFPGRLFGPFVLIGVGVWIFVRKMTYMGQGLENDGTADYHWRLSRAIMGSMWIVLSGVLWLLDELRIFRWSHSWPLYFIAGGLVLIFKRSAYSAYGYGPGYPGAPSVPPAAPVAGTELATTDHARDHGHEQEGR